MSIIILKISIWLIDGSLTRTTIPNLGGPGSDGNKGVNPFTPDLGYSLVSYPTPESRKFVPSIEIENPTNLTLYWIIFVL